MSAPEPEAGVRVAVFADTHLRAGVGGLAPACLEIAKGADVLLHAGDFSTWGVVEGLAGVGPRLHAVHGNVDDAETRARLPERLTVDVAGKRIAMIHDAGPRGGRLARLRRAFPDADVVVFGHSHMPSVEADDGFTIFNPGSPTQRRRAPARTIGLIVARAGELRFEHVVVG